MDTDLHVGFEEAISQPSLEMHLASINHSPILEMQGKPHFRKSFRLCPIHMIFCRKVGLRECEGYPKKKSLYGYVVRAVLR
jgi:hypothetical protein